MSLEQRTRIMIWLEEEGFNPVDITNDQNSTGFTIRINVANLIMDVVKEPGHEAVVVRSDLILTEDQLEMFRGLNPAKMRDFLWNLKMALLTNIEISAFQVTGGENLQVFIQSRGAFRDGLMKERIIQSILVIHKSITMVVWMLERVSGVTP